MFARLSAWEPACGAACVIFCLPDPPCCEASCTLLSSAGLKVGSVELAGLRGHEVDDSCNRTSTWTWSDGVATLG